MTLFIKLLVCNLLGFGIAAYSSTKYSTVIPLPQNVDLNNLDQYLVSNTYATDLRGSDCKRPCVRGQNRVCYDRFYVENYSAMGPACGNCSRGVLSDCNLPQCVASDGFEKSIITMNRQVPGPLIEVCQNDLIVIDTLNLLHSDTFSIHWHGMLQRRTPYMDGVPYVTQCPITPLATFRYAFYAEEAGTYFYHSHSGIQRYSGAYGALIVKQPTILDTVASTYDRDEHVVIVSDYHHEAAELFMIGLPTRPPGLLPEAVLINGRGRFFNNATQTFTATPYETFYVQQGLRYRFRIISASSTVCPIQIQIQNHRMIVIATDGTNVNPVTVDTLVILTGERYDVVVTANQGARSPGLFWFHAKSIGACLPRRSFQTAVISYQPNIPIGTVPPNLPNFTGYTQQVTLNDHVAPCGGFPNNICVEDLKAPEGPDNYLGVPDQKFYMTFTVKPMVTAPFFNNRTYTPFFNIFNQNIFLGTVNDISNIPQSSPLLSQFGDADFSKFCGVDTPSYCNSMQICVCSNMLNVTQNALVEVVLIDSSPDVSTVIHPIHFHGFKFTVLSQGQFLSPGNPLTVQRIKEYEAAGLLKGNNTDPAVKDTIGIHSQGYTVIRFRADNPGKWLVHCHVEDHMVFGMSVVLNVAGPVPPIPKKFPTCGNFF